MARALLTDGERKALTDEDMDDNTRSTHLSRIKNKLDRLSEDARLLRENRPEIYDDAREAFVAEEIDERVDRLEREVERLQEKYDDGEGDSE